jgi:hypothetical protein
MIFTIKGRIPSKKNSKIMVCRGKFPMLLPSENYTKWHKEASKQLPKPDKKELHNIHVTLYAPDKRAGDLTNKAESIMDLLVDNKLIKDDNWFVLESVVLLFGGVDKDNPRAVIELT